LLLADQILEATPLESEDEAEAFVERNAPRHDTAFVSRQHHASSEEGRASLFAGVEFCMKAVLT
jgi:hypothetical protein